MQNNIKLKNIAKFFLAIVILYGAYFIFIMKPSHAPNKCEYYTKHFLSNEMYVYAGKEYLIHICSHGYTIWNEKEIFRIQIHDNNTHELLGTRFFKLTGEDTGWGGGGGGHSSILAGIEKNYVYYYDNNKNKKIILIPPTWWDWIYAKLP